MADVLVGKVSELGTRETSTGKTVYRVKVEPLDGSLALTWSAWPEVGEELVMGRTYEFETEIKQGDRAKFHNITRLVREVVTSDSPEVAPGSPMSAPQAESAGTALPTTGDPRYAALRAAIDVWRTETEFTPSTADGAAGSSAGAVIEYADVFALWLRGETTDAVPVAATQRPDPVVEANGHGAPPPNPTEFRNAGELMAWAASTHRLSVMDVTRILGVEKPSDIDDPVGAATIIATHMEGAANG